MNTLRRTHPSLSHMTSLADWTPDFDPRVRRQQYQQVVVVAVAIGGSSFTAKFITLSAFGVAGTGHGETGW